MLSLHCSGSAAGSSFTRAKLSDLTIDLDEFVDVPLKMNVSVPIDSDVLVDQPLDVAMDVPIDTVLSEKELDLNQLEIPKGVISAPLEQTVRVPIKKRIRPKID